jgi:hypothetical protein
VDVTSVSCPRNYGRWPAKHQCLQVAGCCRSAVSEAGNGRARGPLAAPDPERTLALRTRTAAIHPVADGVRIIAFVPDAAPVVRILTHSGEPPRPPPITPARVLPVWADTPCPSGKAA